MKRFVVRKLFAAQLAIQPAQLVGFLRSQAVAGRPARRIRTNAVDLLRLDGQQTLAEGDDPGGNRLAVRLEQPGIAILRGVFHQLIERILQAQRVLAHESQLVPQLVEPGVLGVVEHQLAQWLVIAMQKLQRDCLVDRDDARIAGGRRKQAANIRERRCNPGPGLAPFGGHDWYARQNDR